MPDRFFRQHLVSITQSEAVYCTHWQCSKINLKEILFFKSSNRNQGSKLGKTD